MNGTQITIAGRVGGNVTLHEVAGGRHVVAFRVATNARWVKDGEWVTGPTTWHTVKAWNNLALHVADSLVSGDPVLVHGRLVVDVWERDGKSMSSYEIAASSVGHDLSFGTTTYLKTVPAESAPVSSPAATVAGQTPDGMPAEDSQAA